MQDSQQPAVSDQRLATSRPVRSYPVRSLPPSPFRLRPSRSGFTLTELLIVIAIIAVLAGLIAAAAVNALRKGRETRIQLEIQNMAGAIENFKNDPTIGGVYPCSVAYGTNPTPVQLQQAKSDLKRAFAKMFPRQNEPSLNVIINKLVGDSAAGGTPNQGGYLQGGMSPSEALVFWLGGFSTDQTLPLSGANGPSFVGGPEILENRKWGYGFDLGQLGPRDDSGNFAGRYIIYPDPITGNDRRINLWTYAPSGSETPFAYFDVSRIKPSTCANKFGGNSSAALPWALSNPLDSGSVLITPLREPLESVPTADPMVFNQTKFVNQDKFQILHPGLDDAWGSGFDTTLFPEGPYIGETADTLTNFSEGTLQSASEQ